MPDLPGNVPAYAGSYTLSVLIGADCVWNAATQAEGGWASILPSSGRGSSATVLRMTENVRTDSRSLIIAINGQSFRTIQDGVPCVYALDSAGVAIGEDAARVSVVVTTHRDCRWTASSSESWIVVATPSGTGPGTVNLDVSRNTGDTRQAFVTIANQRIAVTQRRGIR
jgi:hypothetical protein